MSTFVLRFIEDSTGELRGTARHVATGETASFGDAEELVGILEQMNAVSVRLAADEAPALPRERPRARPRGLAKGAQTTRDS